MNIQYAKLNLFCNLIFVRVMTPLDARLNATKTLEYSQ